MSTTSFNQRSWASKGEVFVVFRLFSFADADVSAGFARANVVLARVNFVLARAYLVLARVNAAFAHANPILARVNPIQARVDFIFTGVNPAFARANPVETRAFSAKNDGFSPDSYETCLFWVTIYLTQHIVWRPFPSI